MTAPDPIDAGALHQVLASIDLGTKRWRKKARVIAILGQWGDPHEISIRELADRAQMNVEVLLVLLGELVEARIVHVVYVGQGSRASVYVIDGLIERWRGVPWTREVHAVAHLAFHVKPYPTAKPARRAAGDSQDARRRDQRAAGEAPVARRQTRRAAGDPDAARHAATARGRGGLRRALIAVDSQKQFPADAGANSASSHLGGPEDGLEPLSWTPEALAVREAVMHRTVPVRGKHFLGFKGEHAQRLIAMVNERGQAELERWLAHDAPDDQGVPAMLDWLEGRCRTGGPSPEFLEALTNRVEPEPPEVDASEPRSQLREYEPADEEPFDREAALEAAARARAAFRGPVDGRMNTAVGGER